METMNPMNKCKGFNMERLLLRNKNGYMVTGYFKDGMIQADGDQEWTRPIVWDAFILLKDLKTCLNSHNLLLEFAIEMVRRYPNSPWIYEQGNKAINKATK